MEDNRYVKEERSGMKVEVNDTYATLIKKVYWWMTLALAATAATAYVVTHNIAILTALYSAGWVIPVLCIGEIVLVISLSARLHKMSFRTAAVMFAIYAVLNGLTLSGLLLVYSPSAVTTAFAVSAGMFLTMAIIGSFTSRDLSRWGSILIMVLVGLLIAMVVNLFVRNSMLDLAISAIGVVLFAGLTVYDAQKIRNAMLTFDEVDETAAKVAVFFALDLYLDFINIFIYLLRILGRRN